jgi:hypothetical protein
MAFPLGMIFGVIVVVVVLNAIDRLSGDQLPTLCAALNASRRARNPQPEHFGKSVKCRKLVASVAKSAKLAIAATYGGKKCQTGLRNTS